MSEGKNNCNPSIIHHRKILYSSMQLQHNQFFSGQAKMFVTEAILDKNEKISSHCKNFAKKLNYIDRA